MFAPMKKKSKKKNNDYLLNKNTSLFQKVVLCENGCEARMKVTKKTSTFDRNK